MFCKNCGNQMADDQKFCSNCGAVIGAAAEPVAPVVEATPTYTQPVENDFQNFVPTEPQPPKKKKTGLIVAISVIVAIVVAGGVCLGIFWDDIFGGKKKSSNDDNDDTSTSSAQGDNDNNSEETPDDGDFELEIEDGGYNTEITNSAVEKLPTTSTASREDVEVGMDIEDSYQVEDSYEADGEETYSTVAEMMSSQNGQELKSTFAQMFNSDQFSISVYGSGNNLVMDFRFKTDIDPSMSSALQTSLNQQSDTFTNLRKQLQNSITTPGVKVVIRYINNKGTILAQGTF